MDYLVWGIGTAFIGACCLLLGYLLGASAELKHIRTSWDAPQDTGYSQVEREVMSIVDELEEL